MVYGSGRYGVGVYGGAPAVWSLPAPPIVVRYRARVTCMGGPASGLVLPITDGGITVDRSALIRQVGSLTVAGLPEWTPDDATDALDPRSGTELLVERVTPTGWVPQGVFSISKPRTRRTASGVSVTVDIDDRANRVSLAGMDRRWVVAAGTSVSEAIRSILTQIAPWCPSDLDDTGDLVAADVLLEFADDPWAACVDLATSVGMELYADPTGVIVWSPATAALSATPVDVKWLSIDRDIDTTQLVNHVRAEWAPARPDPLPKDFDDRGGFEEAVDETSTTSVLSWMGRRVKVAKGDRSLLTSPTAARQAAQIELLHALDVAYSGSGTVAPDALLDVDDVTLLAGDRYRINRLTIDLKGGATGVVLGVPPEGRDAMLLRAAKAGPDRRTREIVVSTTPLRTVLASDPTGSQVQVTPTAAVSGVKVGELVEVLHTGKGERIGIARFLSGNAYARAVLADAPFCYFPLDETTGTPVDVQGAVTVSSMTGVTLGAAGIGDGFTAATVNGATGAGIVLPRAPFNGTARFTVEMLAKATDMTVQRYFFAMEGSGKALGFSLRHTATPSIDAYTGATWPNQIGSTINEAQPTAVHHWAITYDGTDAKLYRDGSQIASEAQTWTLTNPAVDLFVGGRPSNAGFLGQIAGFAFHKQALSAARILAHAQAAGVA